VIRWIVFSRNRPYQLHALLESARRFGGVDLATVAVLHRYDAEYVLGLELVRAAFPEVSWRGRTDFGADLRAALHDCGETMAFSTDDSVFTREVPWEAAAGVLASRPQVVAWSHRCGLHLSRCYPLNCDQPLPTFDRQGAALLWSWADAVYDFACVGSIDATQFRTSDVMLWVRHSTAPNTLEDELNTAIRSAGRPLAACGSFSCYMTIPLNVVQSTHPNRHAGVSVEQLNVGYMAGYRPDVDRVRAFVNESCHQVVPI